MFEIINNFIYVNFIVKNLMVLNQEILFFSNIKMTYLNAQTKNLGNDGDVLAFFQNKLRNLIQHNGGDHKFSMIMEEFKDNDAPLPVGTKTKIKLTHSGHTISQI